MISSISNKKPFHQSLPVSHHRAEEGRQVWTADYDLLLLYNKSKRDTSRVRGLFPCLAQKLLIFVFVAEWRENTAMILQIGNICLKEIGQKGINLKKCIK